MKSVYNEWLFVSIIVHWINTVEYFTYTSWGNPAGNYEIKAII